MYVWLYAIIVVAEALAVILIIAFNNTLLSIFPHLLFIT